MIFIFYWKMQGEEADEFTQKYTIWIIQLKKPNERNNLNIFTILHLLATF